MNLIKDFSHKISISYNWYIKKQLLCFIVSSIYVLSSVIFPNFIELIVDDGIKNNSDATIIKYCLMMLFTGIIMTVFNYLQNIAFVRFGQELSLYMKTTIFNKLLKTNIEFWIENKTGDVYTILNDDLNKIENLFSNVFRNLILNIMLFIGVSIFICYYFSFGGLLIIFLSIILALIQKMIGRKVQHTAADVRKNLGEEASFTNESLSNMTEIQMSGHSDFVISKYNILNKGLMHNFIKYNKILSISNSLGICFNMIGILVVLIFGSMKVNSNIMSIGSLFTVTIYVQRLNAPLNTIFSSYISIKSTLPIIAKILNLLETNHIVYYGNKYLEEDISNIAFQHINFSYLETCKVIFKDFSLSISKGDIIGITGHNGRGKSTLIRLLLNLCKAQKGDIKINEVNLLDLSQKYLHDQIGYMSQNNYLMCGPLRNVLNPMGIKISDTYMINILDKVGLDFSSFNNSLDYYISENSKNISGGEYQKLSIARLLLEDKKVMILDEPTASMDHSSSATICNLLHDYSNERIIIIISHKEDILSICNHIVNLDCM